MIHSILRRSASPFRVSPASALAPTRESSHAKLPGAMAVAAGPQASPAAQRHPSPSRITLISVPARPRLSIHPHPQDVRRTVICGRFAEVCAALEGLAAAEREHDRLATTH